MSEAKFGKRLEELMIIRGYNNNQLTQKMGLSKNAIGNYKNDQIPNATVLYKLSQILGTTMEFLLTGKKAEDLTPEEQQLLEAYRLADPAMQEAAKKLLDVAPTALGKLSDLQNGEKAI